ncbi:MAG: Transcriptional regulator, GntR family domain / Aspartate aminotransferase [Ktedonobacterales bacterium]|jgi:GntR family transcriptional regulator/MocR family aminotransferase|nr:MAG: Transcriptional regulator, GntR family domain / Aspartate aminotransferase [Ktedonobacterales bacterium]
MTDTRTVDLLLPLDTSASAPEGLTRQIYAQMRAAIVSGRLRAGERLPPTRDLARRLGVARLTVSTAYEWLRAEGYVYGRVGAGTFVAPVFAEVAAAEEQAGDATRTETPPQVEARNTPAEPQPPQRVRLTAWARRIATISTLGAGNPDPAPYDFRPNSGAAEAFPWARWRRVVGWQDPLDGHAERRAEAQESAAREGKWDALLGPAETRAAIAAWLRRSRAVRCEPEQVLVAGSVQQILALLARLLVEPGQSLIVEDPSYIGFHAAFLAEGARLLALPVDGGGLRVDMLPDPAATSKATAPQIAVVTPSHQYPTGVTLALDRRVALLDWARRAGVVLVEDDYDGDLRLEGQPLEALRGLDDRDEVIYLGTFSKALYPAMRLGYAVLPRWLIEPVARARAASDRHPTWRDALAVARFIEAGELDRHLARVRRLYRARRDALVAALRAELGDMLSIGPAEAGIHLLARLPAGVDDMALTEEARTVGLALSPLSPHYRAAAQPGLLLGFGALDEERLAEGVRLLAPLVRRVTSKPLVCTF